VERCGWLAAAARRSMSACHGSDAPQSHGFKPPYSVYDLRYREHTEDVSLDTSRNVLAFQVTSARALACLCTQTTQ